MNEHPLLFQLKMARDWSIEVAESCPGELATVQLNLFNNTIQWHVGHVLTVAERMLFHRPVQDVSLPHDFSTWFEFGTSPAQWEKQPPSLEELVSLLRDQQQRMLNHAGTHMDDHFEEPYYGFTQYDQCIGFVAIHEALHIGKIEEMLRVIRANA